ncbi:MAG: Spy/CpxP family protein refolding chaperone [Burkholderiales bacterium]|jgi:Spy/CpxP family protein refolding chaperone|nr:Spy/CpxP family protein refolding chaperone [Burkholderiales bacterium]
MKKTLILAAIALATTAGMTLNATAQGPNFDPANCPSANCPMFADCPLIDGKRGFEGKRGGKRGYGPGYHQGGRMMNGLDLTDAQKAQISDIRAQQREETHAKIRAVLTPEQQAVFDTRKQQRDAWFEQRMGW